MRRRLLRQRFLRGESLESRCLLTAGPDSASTWFQSLAREPREPGSDRWIVQLQEDWSTSVGDSRRPLNPDTVLQLGKEELRLDVVRGLGQPGLVLVESTGPHDLIQQNLRSNPLVTYFEFDRSITAQDQNLKFSNDPEFSHQADLYKNNATVGHVNAPAAWFTTRAIGRRSSLSSTPESTTPIRIWPRTFGPTPVTTRSTASTTTTTASSTTCTAMTS